ncbi:type I inositol 3,4-bisphosphate 4-phosphatase isoform X2 [Lingula anatina]|uniref:phosphatidylinositol-3,4-bisphosphate 4-phosphatase n=1 Tax=Lingula anatina TaxID=7574 RepID=A0A1S3JU01_LINAN|nr:type I inositol 3,4-bisphosphate 4-phosphatase isoform X2 [Lingula anatina]|eukprot:XP_013413807.1 type I inositol 3,4-bisphosphate 4-phosphatase isoform X2 [Lingula anatina]
MRFNAKEMAALAKEPKDKFDQEGVLWVKEKQEGLFRKGEVYVQRWCRLRGNVLFYFKSKEPTSEPYGAIILERCTVELDLKEEMQFSFQIVFEGDDRVQFFAARTEEERDTWIEVLHIASYECLKMQLESLREQIRNKTGKDPIDDPDPTVLEDNTETGGDAGTDDPAVEICITCSGLPKEPNGRTPNPFVSIHIMAPPDQQWLGHAHTEVVEKECNPIFLKTVSFSESSVLRKSTRVKLVIFDCKERLTGTMSQIGQVIFTLSDLITAPDNRLTLRLNSSDFSEGGTVTVMSWENDEYATRNSRMTTGSLEEESSSDQDGPVRPRRKSSKTKCRDMLKPFYNNIMTKTFRFPTSDGSMISVHEYMGESKLCFYFPQLLLKEWITEERARIEQLQDLGELKGRWEQLKMDLQIFHVDILDVYTQCLREYEEMEGVTFKASARKGDRDVEFIPVNLHLQRMWVTNEKKKTSGCYDIVTVGSFTAYAQKYKQGGVKRMMQQQQELLHSSGHKDSRLTDLNKLLDKLISLRKAVQYDAESVSRAALQGSAEELIKASSLVTDKTRQLLQLLEIKMMEEGITSYDKAKQDLTDGSSAQTNSTESNDIHGKLKSDSQDKVLNELQSKLSQKNSPKVGRVRSEKIPDKKPSVSSVAEGRDSLLSTSSSEYTPTTPVPPGGEWKWSPLHTAATDSTEPWDMNQVNLEAALMCLTSKVDEILRQGETRAGGSSTWLEEVNPLLVRLRGCVELVCRRASHGLTFLALQEQSYNIPLWHTVKYRRDVTFSQALTSVTTGFLTKLRSSITNETFLQQLYKIGLLINFESLLSCHGDEMGMLEDHIVAINDMKNVTFKIIQASNADEILPTLSGKRGSYVVQVPCPDTMFHLLPREIQRGYAIRVVPVIFTMGINEHATLADKFGDTKLQEQINQENFEALSSYVSQYFDHFKESNPGPNSVEEQMKLLKYNINSKKSKNVEILHISAEICRNMNGIRFTSCKSAKDRTAMSVTLEQVQILQREHNLAPHVFSHALECFRSEGVRRHNTFKNTGISKYAFNSIQLMALPKLYRPPNGTFGNVAS